MSASENKQEARPSVGPPRFNPPPFRRIALPGTSQLPSPTPLLQAEVPQSQNSQQPPTRTSEETRANNLEQTISFSRRTLSRTFAPRCTCPSTLTTSSTDTPWSGSGWSLSRVGTQSLTGQVTGQVAVQVLQYCEQPRKAGEIQNLLGVRHRQTFRENHLNVFLDKGWLVRTIPDKPQSRLQRYQTPQEGKCWLQTAATRSARPPVSAS